MTSHGTGSHTHFLRSQSLDTKKEGSDLGQTTAASSKPKESTLKTFDNALRNKSQDFKAEN